MVDVKLNTLLKVYEMGSYTRAAEKLSLTQPAVSKHIRQLERELGAELFRRARRGVEPTAAGQALLTGARALLADADALRENIRGMGGKI